ncbi:terminase small subunit [Marinobacter salarius]|uniref:terminase small subunit n=1 Tax=Marinobacter salarius TaxID=1420917 RepID=UPI003BAC7D02
MATQKAVADHLDLSTRRVRTLIDEGVLPSQGARKPLDLDACRVAYIRYLRNLSSGSNQYPDDLVDVEPGTMDYERLRLTRAQADGQEIKNEIARGKTAPIDIIGYVLSRVSGAACGEIDALPLNIRRKHPELDSKIIEAIKSHCVKAQNAVARTDERLEEFLDEYLSDAGPD